MPFGSVSFVLDSIVNFFFCSEPHNKRPAGETLGHCELCLVCSSIRLLLLAVGVCVCAAETKRILFVSQVNELKRRKLVF